MRLVWTIPIYIAGILCILPACQPDETLPVNTGVAVGNPRQIPQQDRMLRIVPEQGDHVYEVLFTEDEKAKVFQLTRDGELREERVVSFRADKNTLAIHVVFSTVSIDIKIILNSDQQVTAIEFSLNNIPVATEFETRDVDPAVPEPPVADKTEDDEQEKEGGTLAPRTACTSTDTLFSDIRVTRDDANTDLILENICKINGDVTIKHPTIENVTGFAKIQEITGRLIIQNNPKLKSIDLDQLRKVGGFIAVHHNAGLTDLAFLSTLEEVDGAVEIDSNNSLEEVSHLQNVVFVGGSLVVRNNPQLNFPDMVVFEGDDDQLNLVRSRDWVNDNLEITGLNGVLVGITGNRP